MTIFEVFLAVLITAFLILFVVSLIVSYSNHVAIKRMYTLFDVLRDREEKDYIEIKRIKKILRGGSDGKSK